MKVLFVLIDGCRVDTLSETSTPNIDRLMERGSWTFDARTVTPSVTLPVHFSIFHSAHPECHGVFGNTDFPRHRGGLVNLVSALGEQGQRTAFYYNWEHLKCLTPSGALDVGLSMDTCKVPGGDMMLARAALPLLLDREPDFAFLYLGCLDEEGHRSGYGGKEYAQVLQEADGALGYVLDGLDKAGKLDGYTILVQSDHGGEGFDHADAIPQNLIVPWVIAGPRIRQGHEIQFPVTVLDTVPTIAHILEINAPDVWQGQTVSEIFL